MGHDRYCVFETALGWCGIAWRQVDDSAADVAVSMLQLPDATAQLTGRRMARSCGSRRASEAPEAIAEVIERIRRHLRGELQDFSDVPLHLDGKGVFARQVYEAARRIPAGSTQSYGELAKMLKRPGAMRAMGQAMGKNPIPLIIPCHRVLAAGRKPGGFSAPGGLATKARMLAIEGVMLEKPAVIRSKQQLRRAAARLRARDPRLAECLSRPIEWRLRAAQSPYEVLFSAVVHQQLSPKAAETILGRVKALYAGSRTPTPEELLKTPDEKLRGAGLSGAKTASLKDLAAKMLDGTVPTAGKIVELGDEEIVQRLSSIRGIGRWTVEMLLIFNLGRMDVLPVDDYAVRRSAAQVLKMKTLPTPKELSRIGEAWRGERTVVSLYLWNYLKTTGI